MIFITLFGFATGLYSVFLIIGAAIQILNRDKPLIGELQPISVIIAARNESQNLPRLLKSLSLLDYPKELFEVILVNDHSTDNTDEVVTQLSFSNLKFLEYKSESTGLIGKKAAINYGIDNASNDILVFTDADCEVPPSWLKAINSRFDKDTDYLLSYSIIKTNPQSSVFRMKNFERSIYYAIATIGLMFRKPITSSACNMAYRKSLFIKANGFDGIGHIRSGDDDLLLMKMMPYIRKAKFSACKDVQVCSYDGIDEKVHHQANIRRASKFRHFPKYLQVLALSIFIYYIAFYASLWFLALSPEFTLNAKSAVTLTSLYLIKSCGELALAASILIRAGYIQLLAIYPSQIILFPLQFIVYAVWGTIGKYRWKA